MSIATLEQREILEAHNRVQSRWTTRARSLWAQLRGSAPHAKAVLTVFVYLFIFAVCFQASRTDFTAKSSAFLSQSNGGSASGQKGFSAPASTKAAPEAATAATPTPEPGTTLPATDEPNTDGPSQAAQFTAAGYSYGQCTYYVSHRRPIPQNWGNARDWVRNAKAAGFTTGPYARPGAIAQTTSGRFGHVAYVEQVQDGKVYVSEMNYVRWNRVTYRWAHESEFTYIY